jgi:membrane-bound inhibitor of C-type lysozyme
LLFVLFFNTSIAQSSPPRSPIIYYCQKGKTFQVQFLSETAQLILKSNKIYSLRQIPSASGTQYTDGKVSLYTKGEEAFIEVNHKLIYNNCSPKKTNFTSEIRYNCEAQVAPFLNKENMTLAQAEKLLLRRDGNLFIYHCYPQE